MHPLYTAVFEPGFFASPQVHIAAVLGGGVAIVSAVTGVFTVMRGQSFGGHALSDVSPACGCARRAISPRGQTPLPPSPNTPACVYSYAKAQTLTRTPV